MNVLSSRLAASPFLYGDAFSDPAMFHVESPAHRGPPQPSTSDGYLAMIQVCNRLTEGQPRQKTVWGRARKRILTLMSIETV